MSWFLSRSSTRADDRLIEERAFLGQASEKDAPPSEPALILLATDAYGAGCRRLHCFEDAEAAARFVKFWYPYRSEDSVLGYWLLGSEPLPVDRAEWGAAVLILVRDTRPGIVYAFNRPDMNSAREFLREEISCGLDPGSVIISWAVPALIETDFRGDTVIFPPAMPEGAALGNAAVTALEAGTTVSAIILRQAKA